MTAESWADAMVRACLQGGILAVVVWSTCRILRGIPAWTRCLLWCVVFVKMLVALVPATVQIAVLPPFQTPVHPVLSIPFRASDPTPIGVIEPTSLPNVSATSLEQVLLALWIAGMALRVGLILASILRVRLLVGSAQPLGPSGLASCAERLAQRLGLKSVPQIRVTDHEVGALVYGCADPIVLVSRSAVERFAPAELEMILGHEFVHVKRKDAWVALLPQVVQILFFFNPIVWLSCREFEAEREAACDERTLTLVGSPRDAYAALLVRLGVSPNSNRQLCLPRVSPHFRTLRRRISMLKTTHESARSRHGLLKALPFALVISAVAVPWSLVHAQSPVKPKEEPARVISSKEAEQATKPDHQYSLKQKAPRYDYSVETSGRNATQILKKRKSRKWVVTAKSKAAALPKVVTIYRSEPGQKPPTNWYVKVVTIQHGSATQIATAVRSRLSKQGVTEAQVYVDPRSNAIVVKADDATFAKVLAIIKELDKTRATSEPPEQRSQEVRKYLILNQTAEEVSVILKNEFAEAEGEVTIITYDPTDNSIVVKADGKHQAAIRDRIILLDKGKR